MSMKNNRMTLVRINKKQRMLTDKILCQPSVIT